ncbi:MAG: hypothetical protein NTW31_00530, partial [Bacteroidetes bacterium]|nr:hypothetical protein [Bacteroidota bacterium]
MRGYQLRHIRVWIEIWPAKVLNFYFSSLHISTGAVPQVLFTIPGNPSHQVQVINLNITRAGYLTESDSNSIKGTNIYP